MTRALTRLVRSPVVVVPDSLVRYLMSREPLFDRPEIIFDEASFDAEIASDFFEIGASGNTYLRGEVKAVVLARLAGTHPASLPGGYRIEEWAVRQLAPGLLQVTYVLREQSRVTKRSTLYRRSGGRWQAVFHQGTVAEGSGLLAGDP
ncbi:nuclear transport factor 2 family protein [Microlunatus flavus]|uniref:DUF4440 domain-containing protein n=1 Tax=Microlunatus flavus TaxID=1036181 RepID=A0A1H9JK93_9ACTN|nr:hypothetical protein [Microlunatus flavus]SEQ87219.1 hypothetical protein SAMN05421756_106240 [Microlunatus flavus]